VVRAEARDVHSILAVGGFAAASAISPIPTAALIESHGWRATLLIWAVVVGVLTIPALLFVFRNRPEETGQHLDGDPAEHETHDVLHGGAPPPATPRSPCGRRCGRARSGSSRSTC
jgi:hypothetical protein